MTEHLRSIAIRVEIDTNKRTETGEFESVSAFAEWWNDRAEEFGLPTLIVEGDEEDAA